MIREKSGQQGPFAPKNSKDLGRALEHALTQLQPNSTPVLRAARPHQLATKKPVSRSARKAHGSTSWFVRMRSRQA